jgi:hypothetical protein
MGHPMLGGNTMLFMVDGLYSAVEGWTDAYPVKWDMAPFNGDFTNSIIASLDQVAVEAVCFDLLRTEYDGPSVEFNRPNMTGVDEYLLQAADSAYWPEGISYDPDNDGEPIGSLGVYEHWNNETDMQYSRDLGEDEGIELVKIFKTGTSIEHAEQGAPAEWFQLFANYPNPFNNGTLISYSLLKAGDVRLEIFDLRGRKIQTLREEYQTAGYHAVRWNGSDEHGQSVSSGVYLYRLTVHTSGDIITDAKRMLIIK